MDEIDNPKLGVAGHIKGWCAILAAFVGGGMLLWGGEGVTRKIPHPELIAYGAFAFGGLFALALLFHGTAFGFRVQSLLLACVTGGVAALFAWKGASSEEGWGIGSGALTLIFGVFALVKLKDFVFGRGPDESGNS